MNEWEKVKGIAKDMFLYYLAARSDDPPAVEASLGKFHTMQQVANYVSTTNNEFLFTIPLALHVAESGDPVRWLLFRKVHYVHELNLLAAHVHAVVARSALIREEAVCTILDRNPYGWKFNPAEAGYLCRLICDCEFPVMPATHPMEHDVVANAASMGASPEEVLQMADRVHVLFDGDGNA